MYSGMTLSNRAPSPGGPLSLDNSLFGNNVNGSEATGFVAKLEGLRLVCAQAEPHISEIVHVLRKGTRGYYAKDSSEAERLINKDPAIKNKMFSAEIQQFYPFYQGCIE